MPDEAVLAHRPAVDRSAALAAGVVTSAVNRAVAAAVPLLVLPLALEQLGTTGYGAWATAVSVTSLLVFADCGVGSGLMTRLAALVDGDHAPEDARAYVSSAYAVVGAVACTLLAVVLLSAPVVDWAALLGGSRRAEEVELVVLMTLGAFLANMVASLVVRVQCGAGRQARANLWQAAGSLGSLLMVWLVAEVRPGAVSFLAAAAFTPVVVAALSSVLFFRGTAVGRRLAPTPCLVSTARAASLLGLGGLFMLASVLMTLSLTLDPLIVAWTSSLDEVPDYAIPARLFAFVGTLAVMAAAPLWPLQAHALAAGDLCWVRRTTARMTLLCGALAAVGSLAALLAGPALLGAWLGGQVEVRPVLWAGLATAWVVQTVTGPAFMVQNAAEVLRPQLVGYGLLLLALPAKWLAGDTVGFVWLPWVGAVMYVLVVWPACRIGYRRALAGAAVRDGAPR